MNKLISVLLVGLLAGCGAAEKPVELQLDKSLSKGAAAMLSAAWPRVQTACPGLMKYGDNMSVAEVSGIETTQGYRYSVRVHVNSNSPALAEMKVFEGENCFYQFSPDGARLELWKSMCVRACLDDRNQTVGSLEVPLI